MSFRQTNIVFHEDHSNT